MHALRIPVTLYIGWYLPITDDEKGKRGRYIIATDKGPLHDQEWTLTRFPFSILTPGPVDHGVYGVPLVSFITGFQYEINRMLQVMQRSLELLGVPWVFVQNGTVDPNQINNRIANVITYAGGNPPHGGNSLCDSP